MPGDSDVALFVAIPDVPFEATPAPPPPPYGPPPPPPPPTTTYCTVSLKVPGAMKSPELVKAWMVLLP